MAKVLPIGDVHFPYHDKKALKATLDFVKKEQPDVIIQMGDILDQYAFSNFPKSAKVSAEEELRKGQALMHKFWADIKKAAPKARCIQVLGNHDMRLAKRIAERLPELGLIYNLLSIYKIKGVTTLKSDREYLTIDGVVYCHGWLSQSIKHVEYFNKPVVHGHLHRAGITSKGSLWSMDVGYLASTKYIPLQYGQSTLANWRNGLAVVENGLPRLKLL